MRINEKTQQKALRNLIKSLNIPIRSPLEFGLLNRSAEKTLRHLYFCLFCLDHVVRKVKKAISYANRVIHLSEMPELRILESLDNVEINEHLLRSLKDLKSKSSTVGNGFLVPLGKHRNTECEATIYLGCLELNIFHYLDRESSKSNALFEQQQKKRIVLILQLDDIDGYRDFTCIIPLTSEYDMIRDDCLYNIFDSYISFVYTSDAQDNSDKRIYQLAFSCLPLLSGYSINVEVCENIFAKYFKQAIFAGNSASKNTRVRPIARVNFISVICACDPKISKLMENTCFIERH